MAARGYDLKLEQYARDYESDPEFIAEGLSTRVIEEMLRLLEQKGKNRSWLAEKMGVSRAHVSRMLKAPPNMTLLTIAKVAIALEVTPSVSLGVDVMPSDAAAGHESDAQSSQMTARAHV